MTKMNYQFYTISAPGNDGRCTLHRGECLQLPVREKRLFLGSFISSQQASQYVRTQHHSWHLAECVFCLNSKSVAKDVSLQN